VIQQEHFDHVIVGGGAAGCVVAARLSEDPDRRVLLLEAGASDTAPPANMIPPLDAFKLPRGEHDWSDLTVPQAELNDRQVPISAGRVLGGGGAINFLAWFRGARQDYDGWAERGMNGWDWPQVLPCFRRSEDSQLGASDLHGVGGPIAVTTARDINPMSLAFVTSCVESGLELNRDFNSGDIDGVGLLYSNVRNGERNSAARGYLSPVLNRPNLTVRTGAHVRRVLSARQVVKGVLYTKGAKDWHAVDTDSVVLCAGALRSPQVLMLSGIGPAQHLRDSGIGVVMDLPGVGANLHDHPSVPVVWPVIRGVTWNDAYTAENLAAYKERRRGPLASIGQVSAFLRCGDTDTDVANIQLITSLSDFTGGTDPSFSCLTILLTPRSRGTIRLRRDDPTGAPLVDPNYLADPKDRQTLLDSLQRILEIGNSPVLRTFIGSSRTPAFGSDDGALARYVRGSLHSAQHPVGTCRAGTDGGAVVDPELRVHGMEGLRVIDASIMPVVTRGNTHAPSIMIGERGSDFLLR
jgi:choline dehydrogenase